MTHETFSWRTSKGIEVFAQKWLPENSPRAILALVHGHGEHSSRYQHVAEAFVAKGIGVYSFDQLGHGQSGYKRGYVPGYDAMLDTISELLRKIKERYGELSVFLYGHSMGGNLVVNHALRRKPTLKGVILSAPWLQLAFQPKPIDLKLARIMLKVYPKFTQSSGLDATAISRDPQEVKKYMEDPLVHSKIGPPMFLGATEAGEWAMEHAPDFSYPLLHLHGTADRLTSFQASKEFSAKVKGDATFIPLEGHFHEIHNEPEADRKKVLETLVSWVEERI